MKTSQISQHYQVLIIGGGNAGLSAAAQLLLADRQLDVAILEPSAKHYYQPAWTLVGGGAYDIHDTERNEADFIPKGATWLQEAAASFEPEVNVVVTASGQRLGYDYLIVAPGIQLDWYKIKGAKEALGKNGVCSNYGYELAPYTWECVKNFKGGTALFSAPNTPIKCGGAPQKIMYLASDNWRKRGVLNKADVHFTTGGGVLFGVKVFADALQKVVNRYHIKTDFLHNLKEIRGEQQEAVYEVYKDGQVVGEKTMKFDLLHVVPPMSAPDFIKNSPLAVPGNPLGWVDVDKHTLQHVRYANIFGLGDATSTPNAKTGAAVRKQVPVVVKNLLSLLREQVLTGNPPYNGYGSCPLITGYGKLILAEFDYDNNPTPSFPVDQAQERFSMWLLKRYALPWLYWNKILAGKA
ncbi:pyridine nucleotide-disulfide oxidoreductase [Hymenobacter sp. DG25B]|jgi:sulfide:quinone oxidoreductase|uniref:NAD(P)/FAD-dependent oxidoreductase n=1 Tax=Hymenobacter sp. DG25B TaxID=1385664 RepID=UPI00054087E7|nr:FAD/NAD(P)-binding oxidoreductase [Hymenobacter sp. DG25B]AIZ63569.1 pyridine nucleotide-disulfide oxidoreductase [Hymenobacter sp. DG25B]